jgi:hypothetical protein
MNLRNLYQSIAWVIITLSLLSPVTVTGQAKCEPSFRSISGKLVTVTNKDQTFLPATTIAGPLTKRMEAFAKLYPENVTFIDQVTFQQNRRTGKKKVMMISLAGLSQTKKEALRKDYLKYFSDGTISFPLGESAGHLYTRLGAKTKDFISSVDTSAYRLPSSERLETLMELTPAEFQRTQTYVKNSMKDLDKTIGGFDYDGVKGKTEGKIDANKPVDSSQGHNCTSWICTAPVGDKGESLYRLAGATMANEVHTNPGWWSSWLAAGAESNRVPVVVYWTDQPIKDAKAARIQRGKFSWNFDLH